MKKLFSKLHRFFINPEFVKFLLVGGLGTVLDYAAYLSATRIFGVWYLAGSVLGFLFGFTNNFLWNKYWTFKEKTPGAGKKQLIKYFVVSVIGIAWGNGLLFLLVDIGHMNDLIARLIMTALVTVWNYIANKLWTFNKKPNEISL